MGVHGLWQLLHPAGQPVSLESLEGKVLAVDISIWLHQTMKGMRDRDGNPLPNAHLQGLFSRICKLLFYRIKPVFVFDGGVPALKKQTMAARRERRAEAERESQEISQKLLQNLIKSQAVRQTLGDTGASHRPVPGVKKGRNQPDRDMFELAPLPESEEIGLALNSEEWNKDFELQESWIKEGLAAVSDAHPNSEEFRSLPAEIQHEVLSELKEQKKYHTLSRINKMPEDSTDFSSYQLKKLMKQSRLTARIDEVRKQMSSNTAEDITCSLGEEYQGDEVEARRIVSEDAAHYVLIKGLTKRRQQEEADRYEIQSRVKLEKVDEEDNDYPAERFESEHSGMKNTPQSGLKDVKVQQSGKISSDSDSDLEALINSRLQRKRQKKQKSSRSGMKPKNPGSAPVLHTGAEQIISECEITYSTRRPPVSDDNCTSEDEGFIEVRIDPSAATEDDLFPASIFQTDLDSMCTDSTGAVSEQCSESVAPASSHLIHTKNKVKDFNSSGKLSAGGDEEVSQEDLRGAAFSSRERKEHVPLQAPEADDATTRRKNVLNEILNQLEQKKKSLNEALLDDCGDTIVKISTDETMQVNDGSHNNGSIIVKRSESKDFMSRYSVASCSKALSPEMTSSGAQDKSSGFLTAALDEANSFSESDEELKIAIELSLQTNRPEKDISLQAAHCSLSGSLGNSLPSNLPKHHSVEETSALLKSQKDQEKSHTQVTLDSDSETEDFVEVESQLIENASITTEGEKFADSEEDIQEDTDEDKSRDSEEFSKTVTAGSEHDQPHSPAGLDKQPVESCSNQLQPEDYMIDSEPLFPIMNQETLEDTRSKLESERSALMSERGKHVRMAASITEQINLEAQELLKLFGIPFIISPMEAEAQCAYLDITNQTAGTVTDDSDIWLFGGRRMYKNFFNQSKHVELFTYDSIYSHFGISRSQLINIALLCGSDYTEGISGVGPVRALEIMAEFPGDGLEGLNSFRKWWSRSKSQTFSSENKVRARLKDLKVIPGFPSGAVVDAYLHPQVDDSMEKFTWGQPDLEMLREFTKYKFGWSKEKADQSLLPMMKQLSKKQSQGRLHMYFQPRHFDKTSKIQSERLKKALASMKNPRQTQEDQIQDNVGDSNRSENTEGGNKGTKKRKAAENKGESAGSQRKHEAVRTKPVKKINKKGEGKQLMLVEKQADITEQVATESKKESEKMINELMKDDSELLKMDDTESEKLNVGKTPMNRLKQVKVFAGEQNSSVKGRQEEQMVVSQQNSKQKKVGARSDVGRGKSRRGRTMMGDTYTGGRGKLLVSLDEKQIRRGKHLRKGQPSRGRGIVNLSESSSSDSSSEDLPDLRKFDIAHAKQGPHSKNISSSRAGKGIQEQITRLKATQQNKVVDTQVSERESAAVPSQHSLINATGSHSSQLSSAGKKTYQEFLNHPAPGPSTGIPPVMSTEQIQLKQNRTSGETDTSAGSEGTDIDITKADVSVINRQNLPSTFTYLNRRSREDQLLLHQLKGNRTVNAVEKRLEQGQKKSVLEKQAPVSTDQAEEQDISFEDMLGGLDVVAAKSVHNKGKKGVINKKQPTVITSQTKTLQNKIFQQIGQFGSVLAGVSSVDNSETQSIKRPNNQGDLSNKGSNSHEIIYMSSDEEQPPVNKRQITNKQHSMRTTESNEKEVSSYSDSSFVSNDIQESSRQIEVSGQKEKKLKSSRSQAFDKPIGEYSSGDYDSDRDTRKLSKKRRFLKQMEHLGDSKSVKGLGGVPWHNAEQTVRIKAGKGVRKGKNETKLGGISGKPESKKASEDELMEYAFITADDLGSDFSDFDA